ncbi:helix-turn-helix domain-containing protein [Niallia sp. 03133]|uniref:helix-turn-helix domain-containing protein n=1 Tax=Niallia sp. 03133 TaxID=3458060 RepID=UPI0040440AE2
MLVKKAYKFCLYPKKKQMELMDKTIGFLNRRMSLFINFLFFSNILNNIFNCYIS